MQHSRTQPCRHNVTLAQKAWVGGERVGVGAMPWPVKEIPFLHLLGLGGTRERGQRRRVSIGATHENVAYLRGELSPFRFIFALAKESVIQDKMIYMWTEKCRQESWHSVIDSL